MIRIICTFNSHIINIYTFVFLYIYFILTAFSTFTQALLLLYYIYISFKYILYSIDTFIYILFYLCSEVFFMDYFYRVRKVKRHYFLDFKIDLDSGFSNSFTISLDNYLSTHDLHSTGLDFYGLIAGCRTSGFKSVPTYSDYVPLNFTPSKDYFFIDFPTNFGYISSRGNFLRTGDFHLRANFRFHDFYNFFASNGKRIF